jgi:ubiquitin-protein ligase
MANSIDCTKRLQREYQLSQKVPNPNIYIKVDPINIKMWYFLIHSLKDCDYADGVYMGSVKIPDQYPMRAPVFQMITPSGRFKTYQPLCTTFSHYHPEQWSPNWKIQTTLVGLLSFMHEDSASGIGSIICDSHERKKLAAESVAFNYSNVDFKNIFLEDFPNKNSLIENLSKLNKSALETERVTAKQVVDQQVVDQQVVEHIKVPEIISSATVLNVGSREMSLNAIIWTYSDDQLDTKMGESIQFDEFCKRLAKWVSVSGYKLSNSGKITKQTIHKELKMIWPEDYIKGKKINNKIFKN